MSKEVSRSDSVDDNKKTIDITEEKKKFAGSSNQHGFNYQTTVSVLYLCLGKDLKNFHFVPELEEAGLFDDLVFCYEGEDSQKKYCLLQVKHGLPENVDKGITKITACELFPEKQKGKFILWKYFQSYIEIRDKFKNGSSIEHLIVFTNSDFVDKENLRQNGIEICEIKSREKGLLPKNSFQFKKLTKQKRLQIIQNCDWKCDKNANSSLDAFLSLLVFAVNQPDYMEIDNTVKAKLGEVFNVNILETDSILAAMQGKMWKLQSTKDHESLTPESITQEFEKHAKEIKEKYFHGITFANFHDALTTANCFKDIHLMTEFLKVNKSRISYISSETPALTCLKVGQALSHIRQKCDYPELYFAILDLFTFDKDKKRVKNTLLCKKEFVLVIKCNEQHELATKNILDLIEDVQPGKNIILVCDAKCHLSNFADYCRYEDIRDPKWFINSELNLQGHDMKLSDIIGDIHLRKLKTTATIFNELIEAGGLSLGKRIDSFEAIDSYYIELLFKKNFKFEKFLFQNIPQTMVLVFSGMEKTELTKLTCIPHQKLLEYRGITGELGNYRAVFLNDERNKEEDFNVICGQLKSKDIHWLEKSNDVNDNYFKVKQSIHNTKIKMDKYIEENRTVHILTGEPGSGKSVAITKILHTIKETCSKRWSIKIKLLALSSGLEEIRNKNVKLDDILGFLCKAEGLEKPWEKDMLRYTIMETNLCHLFFDGFDEICPVYETTVIQMLKRCKATKVSIWVSSRPQFQMKLEKELDCCSYSPIPFTIDQQRSFLKHYWSNSSKDSSQQQNAIDAMFAISSKFEASLIRFTHEFIGIPLHTLMIAVICLSIYHNGSNNNCAAPNIDDRFKSMDNILSFYDFFVTEKYKLYFREKAKLAAGNPDVKLLEMCSLSTFSTMHKNAALHLLFPHELHSLLTDVEAEFEIEEEIHRVGLLVKENNGSNFIHRTFAEYFVAKRLGEILTDRKRFDESSEKYMMVIEFLKEKYFANKMIRIFLDLMLANTDVHKAIIKNDISAVKSLIKEDKGCIMLTDYLQRSTWQLSASYLLPASYLKGHFFYKNQYVRMENNSNKILTILLPFLNNEILKPADVAILFKTDKLGFNILCYAIATVQGYKNDDWCTYLDKVLFSCVHDMEILIEIIASIIKMHRHVEKDLRHIVGNYLRIISIHKIDLSKYSDYIKLLFDNVNCIEKVVAFMTIAPEKFPWDSCPPKFFDHILQTDATFSQILSEKCIDLNNLRIGCFLTSKEFEKWFVRTKDKNDFKSLINVFKFIRCPTLYSQLCEPSLDFKITFDAVLHEVRETHRTVDLCRFGGRCDNHIVHLEKLVINGRLREFQKLYDEFIDDAKIEVLGKLDYAKIANEVAKKGDLCDVEKLLGMQIFKTNIEKIKLAAEHQHFISCFQKQIIDRRFFYVDTILLFISDKERKHVRKILNCTLNCQKDKDVLEIRTNESSMRSERVFQWLGCYPFDSPKTAFKWSLWEHLYCLIVCQENDLKIPPNIVAKLEPKYLSKILANKDKFPSVQHLFYLATDEQKEEICRHNKWEFLLQASRNYFDEITNQKCGMGEGYITLVQNDIPVDGALKRAFIDVLNSKTPSIAAKFISFFSNGRQLSLWAKFCADLFDQILNQNEPMEMDFIISLMDVSKNIDQKWHENVKFSYNVLRQFSDDNLDKLLQRVKWEQISEVMISMHSPLSSFRTAVIDMDFHNLNKLFDKYGKVDGMMLVMWESVEFTHCIEFIKRCIDDHNDEDMLSLLQYVPLDECRKLPKEICRKLPKEICDAFRTSVTFNKIYLYYDAIRKTFLSLLDDYSSLYHDTLTIWEYFIILFGCLLVERDDPIKFKASVTKEVSKIIRS